MTGIKVEKIKSYIYNKRMISVKNICEHFYMNYNEVINIIGELINEKKVRMVNSNMHCGSNAGNCQGCDSFGKSHDEIDSMIVISLNQRKLMEE